MTITVFFKFESIRRKSLNFLTLPRESVSEYICCFYTILFSTVNHFLMTFTNYVLCTRRSFLVICTQTPCSMPTEPLHGKWTHFIIDPHERRFIHCSRNRHSPFDAFVKTKYNLTPGSRHADRLRPVKLYKPARQIY